METFLRFALDQVGDNPIQILALGAGFDMAYFRLRSQGLLPKDSVYFELDLPAVVKNKRLLLDMTDHLQAGDGDGRDDQHGDACLSPYQPPSDAIAALQRAMRDHRSKGRTAADKHKEFGNKPAEKGQHHHDDVLSSFKAGQPQTVGEISFFGIEM